MLHDLRPYPVMKDSGVPWLGQVPEHWDVLTIRRFSKVFAGATPSRAIPAYWNGGHIPWLASGDVNTRFISSAKQFITEEGFRNSSTKWIHPGSVVIALAGQGKTKGMCATVEFRATCNQSLAVIESDSTIVNYRSLAYYLESRYFDIRSLVGELRDGLNLEHIKDIPVPLSPLPEQAAIVRFLDHADRRIRKAIAAKQRLIRLLQEQKQVIIHQAVTRGLDPDVKLKPSGVEWLGDVPEGWTVAALRMRYSVELGKMLDTKRLTGEYPIPYLRNTDVQWGIINTIDLPMMDITPQEYARYTVNLDDLLVCEGGDVGRSAIWSTKEAVVGYQKALHRLRPLRHETDSPKFMFYTFFDLSKRGIFKSDGSENTIAHLTAEKLRAYRLAFPPYAEQVQIVSALEDSEAVIEAGVTRAQEEISLLGEYRTRLIADVVTGKLDVRAAAARLPEPDALPEELDGAEAGDSEPEADEREAELVEA